MIKLLTDVKHSTSAFGYYLGFSSSIQIYQFERGPWAAGNLAAHGLQVIWQSPLQNLAKHAPGRHMRARKLLPELARPKTL